MRIQVHFIQHMEIYFGVNFRVIRVLVTGLTKTCLEIRDHSWKWSLFEGLTSLVDVGGGTGTVAMSIAKNFPDMKCIVLDLPPVVAKLQRSENLEFVAGDVFQKIPPANAVLLESILHDWNDEQCVRILKNCKEA